MTITPAQLGFIRALGIAVLIFVLQYLGDTTHLSGVVSDSVAAFVSMIALAIEHNIESRTGAGLFGSVQVRRRL